MNADALAPVATSGLLLGLAMGLAHFGALWATLRALPRTRRPRLVFWASWCARMALALTGFRLALFLGAPALAAAVAGFLAARTLLIRRLAIRRPTIPRSALTEARPWN